MSSAGVGGMRMTETRPSFSLGLSISRVSLIHSPLGESCAGSTFSFLGGGGGLGMLGVKGRTAFLSLRASPCRCFLSWRCWDSTSLVVPVLQLGRGWAPCF